MGDSKTINVDLNELDISIGKMAEIYKGDELNSLVTQMEEAITISQGISADQAKTMVAFAKEIQKALASLGEATKVILDNVKKSFQEADEGLAERMSIGD